MRLIPENSGHYDTHIKQNKCCNKQPSLYAGVKADGFFKKGVWEFRCQICGKVSGEYTTPNGAAAMWNNP